MSKMTNVIKGIAVALALSFGLSVAQPKEAKAFFLVAIPVAFATNNHFGLDIDAMTVPEMFVCAVLLPFCFLDQKADAAPSFARQDLIANGYTQDEANQIVADNNALMAELSKRGQKIQLSKEDTKESVEEGIRGVLPNASQVFLDFAATQTLVNR